MNTSLRSRLDPLLQQSPILAGPVATTEQLDDVAQRLGVVLAAPLRELLETYGSVMAGSLPIFGIEPSEVMGVDDRLLARTEWFRRDAGSGLPADAVVVSADGRGNPFVLLSDGRVAHYDHDMPPWPAVEIVANGFEEFVESLLDG